MFNLPFATSPVFDEGAAIDCAVGIILPANSSDGSRTTRGNTVTHSIKRVPIPPPRTGGILSNQLSVLDSGEKTGKQPRLHGATNYRSVVGGGLASGHQGSGQTSSETSLTRCQTQSRQSPPTSGCCSLSRLRHHHNH